MWYRSQQIDVAIMKKHEVRFFFTISNDVRKDRILSPKLFSVYMDDLFIMLIKRGPGCHIDNIHVHVLIMCFTQMTNYMHNGALMLASCAIALQELLKNCHCYIVCNTVDLNFNALKSFCFVNYSQIGQITFAIFAH